MAYSGDRRGAAPPTDGGGGMSERAELPVAVFEPQQPVRLGTCLQRGFHLYTRELGWFAGWGLAVSALQAAMGAATAGWALLLGLCLIVPTKVGLYAIADAAARGVPVTLEVVLSGYKRAPAYVLGLLETALLVVGLLALVLPMFLVAFGLTWTTVALHRRQLGAIEAVQASFRLSRAHLGLTLGVCAVGFVLDSVATGTILLGVLAAPLIACLKTVAFEQIDPQVDLLS